MVVIHCKHWSDVGLADGGKCAIGLHGGNPSRGTCRRCDRIQPESTAQIAQLNARTGADEVSRRERICRACENVKSITINRGAFCVNTVSCSVCGCGGLSLVNGKCPLGKWAPPAFEEAHCVTLERTPDVWDGFVKRVAAVADWPLPEPQKAEGIDGKRTPKPPWWKGGFGAWGCYRSHLRIIEDAISRGVESVFLLEDDAMFVDDFAARYRQFMADVPDDWDAIYLGGTLLRMSDTPPRQVNNQVRRAFNINRTHAWGIRGEYMKVVYRHLVDIERIQATNTPHHIDHWLGVLHADERYRVYCPNQWLIGQSERISTVAGKSKPAAFWNVSDAQVAKKTQASKPSDYPVVAVMGLHRSGSSCLAGVLHKLGVHMGEKLGGYEGPRGGGYEAHGLARLCEDAYPFPSFERKLTIDQVDGRLREHIHHNVDIAKKAGVPVGLKYPTLCLMADELVRTALNLRLIFIQRPIKESLASIRRRCEQGKGLVKCDPDDAARLQGVLDEFMGAARVRLGRANVPMITIEYADLLDHTEREVTRIVEFCELKPSAQQWRAAIDHVKPEHRHHEQQLASDSQP